MKDNEDLYTVIQLIDDKLTNLVTRRNGGDFYANESISELTELRAEVMQLVEMAKYRR